VFLILTFALPISGGVALWRCEMGDLASKADVEFGRRRARGLALMAELEASAVVEREARRLEVLSALRSHRSEVRCRRLFRELGVAKGVGL
jgi:hypothetical protein